MNKIHLLIILFLICLGQSAQAQYYSVNYDKKTVAAMAAAYNTEAADRDVVHRRVDLQNDAADLPAECRERLRTHVLTARGGRNGEMLDVAVRPGVPVEQNADELFAAPDAVGFEARIAERPVVPLRVPAFAAGERLFVKVPRFGPAFVRTGFERYEFQLL